MEPRRLLDLLQSVQEGHTSPQQAAEVLATLPLAEGKETVADTHRELRCGMPEAIYGAGKTPQQCAEAADLLAKAHGRVLVTKAQPSHFEAVAAQLPGAEFHPQAQVILWRSEEQKATPPKGKVLVLAAGTSDLPIAQEAELTASWMGAEVELLADLGVAGLHRLLHHHERLRTADALVVVAGMEGALPSVVAGMVACPLVAVPTSVGYGASFQGLTALLAMLNSCAPGVGVVNIDNGFGGGVLAAKIALSARSLQ